MRITKTQLKKIIKEELGRVLNEQRAHDPGSKSAYHQSLLTSALVYLQRALDLVEKHGKSLDDPMTTLELGVGKGEHEVPYKHLAFGGDPSSGGQATIGEFLRGDGVGNITQAKSSYDTLSSDYDKYKAGMGGTDIGTYCKSNPDGCEEETNRISRLLAHADKIFKRLEKYN